ncbi:MAG: hypothetical protein JRJ48_07660 [Deltaproteobacteria bacterium]|nr:hypothetical protein [Deltaproteobacteria bacterium]
MSVQRFHRDLPSGKKGRFVFWCLLLCAAFFMMLTGSFAGATTPGAPAVPTRLPRVPTRVTGKTLSHAAFADLSIQSITWKSVNPKNPSEAEVTVKVKNVGLIASKPTTVSGVLKCKGKALDKKGFRIKALKPGKKTEIKWRIHWGIGKNVLIFSVQDPVNKKNNRREASYAYLPRIPVTPGRSFSSMKLQPDLAVTKITFDDLRLKETGTCQARIEVKNVERGDGPVHGEFPAYHPPGQERGR